MGPVTSKWPDDGIVHLDSGMIWAFGQHKYEAAAAPLLLGSFWAGECRALWAACCRGSSSGWLCSFTDGCCCC
jgi:hypothetical protein